MDSATMGRNGYKRLNLELLNFADESEIDKECVEDIAPIRWSKKVLSGEKSVVIKKQ